MLQAITAEGEAPATPVELFLGGLDSASSRRTMAGCLPALGPTPWLLSFRDLVGIRSRLQTRGLSPASVNKHLAAARGCIRAGVALGLVDRDAGEQACSVRSLKASRLPAGRMVAQEELRSLLEATAGTPRGRRDRAVLAVLTLAGLRRAELADLELADFSPSGLRVIGKGNKERLVPVPPRASQLLEEWLEVRGMAPGPLFCRVRRGGNVELHKLTTQAIWKLLRELAAAAGVESFSPHDLRRTFISMLLDRRNDLSTVQRIVGHASPVTTARYDRRSELAAAAAANTLEGVL